MSDRAMPRVIYADDDEGMRNLVSTFLMDQGIDLHACASAAEAFALVESIDPDIVVLDLDMPGIDGFQAARRIRERDQYGRIRLIALTGVAGQKLPEQAARAGFDEFVKKPVSGQALLNVLGVPKSA
jgi:CheY-like chemotaxis protein